ncbi:Acetophenone carboxylase gamma subunit [Limihaloglobus sulfuriphilus]|uniref:Acetophenone carboxylase gamma subunit n=1 Tax=Limihaloglobus sulfuriphilus TaxID=1851148 RepID=A0A1Q2MBF9_9BACT|nr:hydantoinase/oxoprolinase family protein [Limihaloglobus sulfuriphilus]AQQ70053.1 Acetophenone carboxylase gamma subunit [Limihaloglobus sulfuriphilus]
MNKTIQSYESQTAAGLGIDAGGTYTDIVVFSFRENRILAKSKALTTKWDFTEGIEAALDKIDSGLLCDVGLVSVSTTLATNAIVEGHGQKVGLLLMPAYSRFDDLELFNRPAAVVKGQMEIDGSVVEPVDPDEIARTAEDMIKTHDVKAFAVSGFGATINPSHEIEVMKILRSRTGLGVTCGHELSQMLNFKTRAATAVLNARIIPYVENLFANLESALAGRNINAPIMVVKGDGSLMSVEMAKERSVETVFSGPAASVAGAKKLTGLKDALVVDIGGTTTDTAAIKDGKIEVCDEGNIVANVHTHVKALNMRTKGLGGDSAINILERKIAIGPMRATPVSFLAARTPEVSRALDYIFRQKELYSNDTRAMQILFLTSHREDIALSDLEKNIIELLKNRPHCLDELAAKLDRKHWSFIPYRNLFMHNIVSVAALTPTDILHVQGKIRLWDSHTADILCRFYADMMNLTCSEFCDSVLGSFTSSIAVELLKKLMDNTLEPDSIDTSGAAQAIIGKWLAGAESELSINMNLSSPIVGIGAPTGRLLPDAAKLFNTDCIIPPDADVANALGAITSSVSVSKTVKITAREDVFYIEGIPDCPGFEDYAEARKHALEKLVEIVNELAHKSGTLNPEVETSEIEKTAKNKYGTDVYLGTLITATVTGRPAVMQA